jgi:transcriptional regulator with XRE-family HTH domain
MSPRKLGQAIRRLREQRGLTQEQLAEKAKVSQPYLSHLEGGRRQSPSVTMVHRIAKALGVKIEDVL